MDDNGINNKNNVTAKRFGAFGGVFTPSVLTILGVILFLRAGWVVGNVGLGGAITVIVLSYIISIATGLSLSAIATSMTIKTGGNYFMISRTLGLEIGGSIGIPLYMSQALSFAFYAIGFTEGLQWIFPQLNTVFIASTVCILLTAVAYIGADWAVKIQYVILAVLGLSLASFFSSHTAAVHSINWFSSSKVGFWAVFAVFFPAVTGLEVGVSMSGDLKNPQRDIPIGTLSAIGITFLIYLAQAWWLAKNVPGEELLSNLMIMKSMSRWPVIIIAGLLVATLSSALGGIMAAPRTMQALANDRTLPKILGKGNGPANEPRIATVVTFVIAEGCVLLGGLDAIAPVITMFFLNTYGVINFIAALESIAGNPSYRPKFKVHWAISLIGGTGCYLTMFLINAPATIAAMAITILIFILLSRKELLTNWGDVRYGLWFSLGRYIILKLDTVQKRPINWRPNVMVFSGNSDTRKQLLNFADWLGRGRGLVTMYNFIIGDEEKLFQHRKPALTVLKKFIQDNELHALSQVHITPNFRAGVREVAQAHGMGPFRSNLVLMGWCDEECRKVEFGSLLRELHQLEKSVLLLQQSPEIEFGKKKIIDVWWSHVQSDNHLMMMIAHLVSGSTPWEDCQVNLNIAIETEEGRASAQANLEDFIKKTNLDINVNICSEEVLGLKMPQVIQKISKEADLVIMKMDLPEQGQEEDFILKTNQTMEGLSAVLLVKSMEEVELTLEESS